MKVAFAVWRDRIAVLFDSAGSCLIAETNGFGAPVEPLETINIPVDSCTQKVNVLTSIGVRALVCGAISKQCEAQVVSGGLELHAYVAGDITAVMHAWSTKTLLHSEYSMPGCACPRRRCMRRRGRCAGRFE